VAFGAYRWNPETSVFTAAALDLSTVRSTSIAEVVSFLTPTVFPRFGLRMELARDFGRFCGARDEFTGARGLER
jgi:hypothetical protein